MIWYAILTALFFSLLWRETTRERLRLFLIVFLTLMGGGLLTALFMYRFTVGR